MSNPKVNQIDLGGTTYDVEDQEARESIASIELDIDSIEGILDNKQDKLTNPLTQSDVVNNLTSTATNKPLSAAQGRALNTNKANIGALIETTSSNHNIYFKWTNDSYLEIWVDSTSSNHNIYFKWTNDSYLEIWVDSTKVVQLKGFKRYD